MTDDVDVTEQAFPEIPATPTYTKLQTAQRKQILDQQVAQFEQEMAGHFSNLNRLRATHEAAPAGDDGAEAREECVRLANDALKAIETIQIAIDATKAERAAL